MWMRQIRKIFRRKSQDGTSVGKAIRYEPGFNELNYIATKFKCGSCDTCGQKEVIGKATMVRKFPDGKIQAFRLYRVECRCGVSSTFWYDTTESYKEFPMPLAPAEQFEADGKIRFVSGNGTLPDEALKAARNQGFDSIGDIHIVRP